MKASQKEALRSQEVMEVVLRDVTEASSGVASVDGGVGEDIVSAEGERKKNNDAVVDR
jgi:hypothetical protein